MYFQRHNLDPKNIVWDTGGYYKACIGYAFDMNNYKFAFFAKTTSKYINIVYQKPGVVDSWFHVAVSCTTFDTPGCIMYINGCVVPTEVTTQARTHAFVGFENFLLGDIRSETWSKAHLTMDDFSLWEEGLSDAEVWHLFVQYA